MIPSIPMGEHSSIFLRGSTCAMAGDRNIPVSLEIANGRISHIFSPQNTPRSSRSIELDLSGFLIMPGLINPHDHLHFSLHPRLGNPPYRNYVEWGEDIHTTFPEEIAPFNAIPRDTRLWWGALRNLLCGVTTVCHHDQLWTELQRIDFPIRVVQRYGWAHSVALGGDLRKAYANTPDGAAFFVHAGEGIDELAMGEISKLHQLEILNANTVLIHALKMYGTDVPLIQQRGVSLIFCPSSNQFLFQRLPEIRNLCEVTRAALGSDSPLTATGDLLDEIQYATEHCGITAAHAYRMTTEYAAAILHLNDGEGRIRTGGPADLIAVRNTDENAENRLQSLSISDIELVMIRGHIQLVSDRVYRLLHPNLSQRFEPLWIGDDLRWLRAPVTSLLKNAESVLGVGQVRMSRRSLRITEPDEADRVMCPPDRIPVYDRRT